MKISKSTVQKMKCRPLISRMSVCRGIRIALIVSICLSEYYSFARCGRRIGASELEVKISLSTDRQTYKVGEPVIVTYAIENIGGRPFYVPPDVELAPLSGWFEIKINAFPKAHIVRRIEGPGDSAPGYKTRNILADVQGKWLPLAPGMPYGKTVELNARFLTPGTYTLVAHHHSQTLSPSEIESLCAAEYRVLLGSHQSAPVTIEVQ